MNSAQIRDAGDHGSLTFAHLTDPHMTSPEGAPTRALLNKRALSLLSWRRHRRHVHDPRLLERLIADLRAQRPDHLAITGDLTQLGLPQECRAARAWLDSLAPPERVSLVPGNHDRLVSAPWRETIGLWEDFLFPTGPDGDRPGDFPTLRVRGPVAFIGLSSACPTPPLLATGRLGADQRDRLSRLLDSTGRSGLFRVVLIHHPPLPGTYKWRKRLVDAPDVAAAIAAHGAELVLHGHTHRIASHSILRPAGARIPVVGLASASAREDDEERRARYSLWSVQAVGQGFELEHRGRVFDPSLDAFRDDPGWDPLARD
jgi:3',5'-cyclic AMP phosphodiesterase CpdA